MAAALPLKIFIIEDNKWYGELLAHRLGQNPNHSVQRFSSAKACLEQLSEPPDFITLDYSLPDARGEQLLRQIRERLPGTEVLVISGQEVSSTAVSMLRQQVGARYGAAQALLGEHATMQQVRTLIVKAARTTITVNVSGETGTGKELVAKAIHFQSDRASLPFVAVNMAAIPRELVESELFGHEKGAFAGAVARRVGRLEEANGGTLFLDEIADLDLSLQAKLLRVLQEREVTRVGGNQAVAFDVRLMVATHRDLLTEVQAGRFREDLYYRLLGLPITLPPLRQRGNDILLLAEVFMRNFCCQNNLPLRHLSEGARARLLDYPFPGNVRELKAVVELATVLADDEQILGDDLPLRAVRVLVGPGSRLSLREQTTAIVQQCLDDMNGDVLAAAARLRIGKSTIYRMIQQQELRVG